MKKGIAIAALLGFTALMLGADAQASTRSPVQKPALSKEAHARSKEAHARSKEAHARTIRLSHSEK